jgi:phosphoribosylformylglycinamidine cyclo-ligase
MERRQQETGEPPPRSVDYKAAGVDIDAGHEAVRRIRELARGTFTPGVLSDIGSFGGLFKPDLSGLTEPVLVSSADGVGTKLKVAFRTGRHDTIGVDLVNHCVNDILVQGATPLFFLDYLASGRLSQGVTADVVRGLASACADNRCALLGGETAEMPGFYADGEYDLAGFIVGLVDRPRLVDGSRIRPGDRLIGLPSTGLHTNGYSLARHIIFDTLGLTHESTPDGLDGSVGDVLLRPHRSYLELVGPVLAETDGAVGSGIIKGLAHITGGGLTDNLPRVLPEGTAAEIDRSGWQPPPVFRFLQQQGRLSDAESFRTFNMGIGMVVVCDAGAADALVARLQAAGESGAVAIGSITAGDGTVSYV